MVGAWSAFNWLELGAKAVAAVKDGILKLLPAVKTAGKNVPDAVVNAVNAIRNLIGTAKSAMGDVVNVYMGESLPGYVDDVVEGYYHGGFFYMDEDHAELINGEKGKIYVDILTNISYRYCGAPDLWDKFVLCAGPAYAVGATGGGAERKLTVAEMPEHSHYFWEQNTYNTTYKQRVVSYRDILYNRVSNSAFTTGNSGGNNAHNNMPPYYALLYIQKL